MSTDPRVYLPPHVWQGAILLARDGVDDCLVCSTLALVNGASLGEVTRTAQGNEPAQAGLTRIAKKMRDRLDDPDTARAEFQTGSLPPAAAGAMVAAMWPHLPPLRPRDIDYAELVGRMDDGHVAVVAINPSRIVGPSPLHRVGDVGHAVALLRTRMRDGSRQLLVDDPFRKGGKGPRGEWVPARHIKQAAYRDSDRDLSAVWTVKYGAWTASALARREAAAEQAALETQVRRLRKERNEARTALADCQAAADPDCSVLVKNGRAAAWEVFGNAVLAHTVQLLNEGEPT